MSSEPLRVTAAILWRGDRLLIAQRRRPAWLAGLWELPGGKIEGDESPEACLGRELAEELGIEVRVGRPFGVHRHRYPELHVELHAYEVELTGGEPEAREHAALAWIAREELGAYVFAPADVPFVERLASDQTSARASAPPDANSSA